MLVLAVILPITAFVIQIVIFFISLYTREEIKFPILLIPLFLLFGVFLRWLWVINRHLNKNSSILSPKENTWFKRSYYFLTAFFILILIGAHTVGVFLHIEDYISGLVSSIISFLTFIVMILGIASYVYCIYFTGKLLELSFKDKTRKEGILYKLPFWMKVWVFPLGIPAINIELKENL